MKLLISMVAFIVTVFTTHAMPRPSQAGSPALFQIAANNQLFIIGHEEVIKAYLHIKNALASDNTKDAAAAGKELQTALAGLEKQPVNAKQKKILADMAGAAENISENADNIKHQRKHFLSLSEGIYNLVKTFGSSQTLYKAYCPMAKGMWLSKTKTIENPYYGSKMLSCGELKETINPGK